jgi:glycosyltransferase involved in cell wall biosynthesis
VSDGSTDRTDDIVRAYAADYPFIHLHRITEAHPRNFAAQVHAINAGLAQIHDCDCGFIGNLDSDISLEPTYFERLLGRFAANPRLGLAGGFIQEQESGGFKSRLANSCQSVPHAIQLFRRECLDLLGGYVPLPYGGPDWHAEVRVRMNGWHVESFGDLPVFHHRPTGTAGSLLGYWFQQGQMDFALGSHPVFEIGKVAKRLRFKPYALGAMCRLAGFGCSYVRREERPVSDEFVTYLRQEQWSRLSLFVSRMTRAKWGTASTS